MSEVNPDNPNEITIFFRELVDELAEEKITKRDIKDIILSPYGYITGALLAGWFAAKKLEPVIEDWISVGFGDVAEKFDFVRDKKAQLKLTIKNDITLRTNFNKRMDKVNVLGTKITIVDTVFINIVSFEEWVNTIPKIIILSNSVKRLIERYQKFVRYEIQRFEWVGKQKGFITGDEYNALAQRLQGLAAKPALQDTFLVGNKIIR